MDLWDIPVIDHHAHNVLKPEAFVRYSYSTAFTEGHDREIVNHHARHTLCYRRSLRDIAAILECNPEESAILKRREELGLERLTKLCFQAAKLDSILLDDGFLPNEILPLEWHQQFVPVKRLLRLEWLAENIILQADNFEAFLEQFLSEIDPIPKNVVGFKSIIAYRTGLDVQPVTYEEAKSRFYNIKKDGCALTLRLVDKTLLDFLLLQALEVASNHNIPVQFHTGFGDSDLDLRLGNPLHLRLLLEDSRYRNAKFVFLHASYPYVRQAAYLASVYPHVYLDFGLVVPLLSVAGMRSVIQMQLELAPTSKLMYSSDAHLIPELYYLGAKWGREVLQQVLEQAIADGDLSARDSEKIAVAILGDNARQLYKLSDL